MLIFKVACRSMGMELGGKETKTLTDVLYYASLRYADIENPYKKEWCRRFLIELFNNIYQKHTLCFFREPLPFDAHTSIHLYLYTLIEIRKMGIEPERIDNILREMQYSLFSCMPTLNPNRFALYGIASLVARETGLPGWAEYERFVRSQVDFSHLLTRDLYDMSITPKEGVVGIYLLAKLYGDFMEDVSIDKEAMRERIVASSFWKRLEQDEEFLKKNYSLNGYSGLKLFLDYEYGQGEV